MIQRQPASWAGGQGQQARVWPNTWHHIIFEPGAPCFDLPLGSASFSAGPDSISTLAGRKQPLRKHQLPHGAGAAALAGIYSRAFANVWGCFWLLRVCLGLPCPERGPDPWVSCLQVQSWIQPPPRGKRCWHCLRHFPSPRGG